MSTRKDINQEWQELREDGVLIREIAARFGVSRSKVVTHTLPPERMKRLKMRNELICDLFEQGVPVTQIAGIVNIDTDLVKDVIKTTLGKNAAPKKPYKEKKPKVDPIPLSLKRKDDCPHRVTRGLTSEDYERLLEVNAEYDRRVREAKNTDAHGNAGYIRNVKDDD